MLQIYVYDDTGASFELDLYEQDPLKLTLSIEDIKDIPRVNSAFSKQFRVPATQTNSRVFKWWYEVNTVDFDITKRVRADLYSDGLFYKSGHIRIQNAYVNQQTSQVDLELVFFGETRDFASQVGEITLDKLSLQSLNHELTIQNVQDSWDGNLVNGDVIYALADRGYDYDDDGVITIGAEVADSQHHTRSFQVNHGGGQFDKLFQIEQFTPMVRVRAIIDAIFAQTEYSYSSDSYFNDAIFDNLYTDGIPEATAFSLEANGEVEAQSVGQQDPRNNAISPVIFPTEIKDNGGNYSETQGRYHVPIDGTYSMNTRLTLLLRRNLFHPSTTYEVEIMRRTPLGDIQLATSGVLTTPAGLTTYNDSVTVNYNGYLAQDVDAREYVYIRVTFGSPLNHSVDEFSEFNVTTTPSAISVNRLLKYDVKCVDFLKSILTKFKMIMSPNPNNEFEFVIQPWQDYMGSGDRLDWTEKLDTSKDITLTPIFFDQSQLVDFTDQPDEDLKNKPFQELNGRTYGALQFDSQNDLLTSTRKVETIFAPTPVDIVPGFDANSTFVIPFFTKEGTEESDHGHLQNLPMRIKPRLLFWNGRAAQGANEDWYYTDGTTKVHNTTDYPRFTPYSEFPTTANTLNLNWFRDEPYFVGTNLGQSMYEAYWNQYIQELYSPLSRVLTAYFNLDSNDLRILSFNDIIFIQNAYYRVIKVYDAPIDEVQTVKVDLAKILDVQVYANPGDPTPGGGGIDDIIVVGGGGSPVEGPGVGTWGGTDTNFGDDDNTWGNPTGVYYYTVQACINPGDTFVTRHSSQLNIGDSVKMSGVHTC